MQKSWGRDRVEVQVTLKLKPKPTLFFAEETREADETAKRKNTEYVRYGRLLFIYYDYYILHSRYSVHKCVSNQVRGIQKLPDWDG